MQPDTVRAVLDATRAHWHWANDIEITLEANPRSVEIEKFEGFSMAGINRVSLGVQALRAQDLKRLGRLHDVADAERALGIARSVFDRVTFDLIYARQSQSLHDWESELSEALDLAGDHMSLYQLTVEQGTAFWDRAQLGKLRGLPNEDLAADMYELTQDLCEKAGFSAYEVSNHARPGAESRHNLIYWRGGDYVGIGPGAHGRVTQGNIRSATVAHPAELGSGDDTSDHLTAEDMLNEYIMMGLRLTEGLLVDDVRSLDPTALPDPLIAEHVELGLLWTENGRIGTTRSGRMVLNTLIVALLPD